MVCVCVCGGGGGGGGELGVRKGEMVASKPASTYILFFFYLEKKKPSYLSRLSCSGD